LDYNEQQLIAVFTVIAVHDRKTALYYISLEIIVNRLFDVNNKEYTYTELLLNKEVQKTFL